MKSASFAISAALSALELLCSCPRRQLQNLFTFPSGTSAPPYPRLSAVLLPGSLAALGASSKVESSRICPWGKGLLSCGTVSSRPSCLPARHGASETHADVLGLQSSSCSHCLDSPEPSGGRLLVGAKRFHHRSISSAIGRVGTSQFLGPAGVRTLLESRLRLDGVSLRVGSLLLREAAVLVVALFRPACCYRIGYLPAFHDRVWVCLSVCCGFFFLFFFFGFAYSTVFQPPRTTSMPLLRK